MEIIINTDNHIVGTASFIEEYSALLKKSMHRFEPMVTRMVVFFSDENKAKKGTDDKKCVIEARIKSKNPETVTHNADTIKHAFDGAEEKMKALLSKIADQQKDH